MTLCSCIASSSAACVFGGVRLISSARIMFAKIGPCRNTKCRRPVSGSSCKMSVPVISEGIRSGVNWMRLNVRCKIARNRADQKRLGEPGHADEQTMAATKEADEQLLDDLLLADDDFADLGCQARGGAGQFACGLGFSGNSGSRISHCVQIRKDDAYVQ